MLSGGRGGAQQPPSAHLALQVGPIVFPVVHLPSHRIPTLSSTLQCVYSLLCCVSRDSILTGLAAAEQWVLLPGEQVTLLRLAPAHRARKADLSPSLLFA